jgi:hypothetical protein
MHQPKVEVGTEIVQDRNKEISMKSAFSVFVIFCAIGCGPEDDTGDDGFECSRKDRTGTYLVSFETISGNCGDQDSGVIQLDGGNSEPGAGCVYNYSKWSDGDCSFESSTTCELPSDNLTMTVVGKTDQENRDGSVLTGVITMTVRYLDTNTLACSGTYESTAVRQ